jgi:hypothetical protein
MDLVVILDTLVVKIGDLVVILDTLVVKTATLVVIVKIRKFVNDKKHLFPKE